MALFEIMTLDDEMRELIMKNASTAILREHARKRGMRTLRECGPAGDLRGADDDRRGRARDDRGGVNRQAGRAGSNGCNLAGR
jgi:hypothetical protein